MASSSSSWDYDVFLSFRGEDTRKNIVDHLYSALQLRGIYTYKDDEELPRGEDIIMPIFYDVDPSDVRKQKGEFGKAFEKQKLENITKAESWRKALVDAGNLAGWEPNHIANGHEAKGIKEIVDTISDKLFSLNSNSDEDDLVGMDTRVSHLISLLKISSDGVRMVGIWGVGGGGKTTLASSVHMKISQYFEADCIVDNVREESGKHGLKKLQKNILSATLNTNVVVRSVEDGKQKIKSRLCHKKVLVLLDDVDDRKQLEALAGSHKWFGEGSRILITTRNEHLLRSHRVDEVSRISLLSDDEALRLFNRYAYQENKPVEDYGILSQRVVSYAAGLPLALKVLGSFLCDREKYEWLSTLARLENNPEMEIVETLKISYDGLKHVEKELFLDIACFFRGKNKDNTMSMLNACGFYPDIGIKVLIQKALININSNGTFDMHDLVQEMGHYIVRGKHPNNPEKHTRVWKTDEIDYLCSANEIMANYEIEAITYRGFSPRFPQFVSNMKKLRLLNVNSYIHISPEEPIIFSSELMSISLPSYNGNSFPESFQPLKLVYLKLIESLPKELWKGYKLLPCLKELHLVDALDLVTTPDFYGLPCLEKLTLEKCNSLERIHPSLGNHRCLVKVRVIDNPVLGMFPTIVRMEKLQCLTIEDCDVLCEFPQIQTNMDSLVELSLDYVGMEVLPSSIGKYCTSLISLSLLKCFGLKCIEGNFHGLKHLRNLIIRYNKRLEMIPQDLFDDKCCLEKLAFHRLDEQPFLSRCSGFSRFPLSLTELDLSYCHFKDGEIPSTIAELSNLEKLNLRKNQFTRLDFSLSHLTQLRVLDVSNCQRLVQLPELPSSIRVLLATECKSLEVIGDIYINCQWLWYVSFLNGSNVTDTDKLLQSMLQGNAFDNPYMILNVEGLEIPRSFTPPLRKGTRYTLELPENWCNDFCGFLMCATMSKYCDFGKKITMTHTKVMNSQTEFFSNNLVVTGASAWVGYVSFGSLRHTTWWDETSNSVSFSMNLCSYEKDTDLKDPHSSLGVRLVPRKTQSVPMETTDSSQFNYAKYGYLDKFRIKHDSEFALQCYFGSIIWA